MELTREELLKLGVLGGAGLVVPLSWAATTQAQAFVGADVATGLLLAGYDPHEHDYLLEAPPTLMHIRPVLSPHIARYREIADIAASPTPDTRPHVASMYRDVAARNRHLAMRILNEPPDERSEFWSGYASALQAIADEQAQMADQESNAAG